MPTRPRRNARTPLVLVAAVAAVALALAGAVSGAGGGSDPRAAAEAWRSAFEARGSIDLGGRMIVVLAAPSLADRMHAAAKPLEPAAQRRFVREADGFQRRLIAALRGEGIRLKRERAYTRTFNGFSAVLDARALAALERAPGVVGIYPVRAVYPASVSAEAIARLEPVTGVAVPGSDGSGVTVAVLDTGVARSQPLLAGRVLGGLDLVDGDRDASPGTSPDGSGPETHGTRISGIVAGGAGSGGSYGVAPGAEVLPIRVAGWERTDDGSYRVVGRSDVLLAGFERAVDPDGNGDVQDAARVALAALVEPYAGFADAPEARAAAGALRLGTLVVAPAGNDGPATGGLGTLGAPGGAPAALTVGAADLRAGVPGAQVTVEIDGERVYEGTSRVLGAVPPTGVLSLSGADVAVLPGDGTPLAPRVRESLSAGSEAVLVYGTGLPAGAVDLEEGAAAPVATLPLDVGRVIVAAVERGSEVSVEIGPAPPRSNPDSGRVAAFSSWGPAFDGYVKPDLVAPGTGIPTADAGRATDGGARYATVTGSSAAAAVVAGAAALVAQARPDLDAQALAAVLVGSARPLAPAGIAEPVDAQGAGLVDPAAAAAAEIAVEPVSLALGRVEGRRWRSTHAVTVRNLSDRRLRIEVSSTIGDVTLTPDPARLTLGPGKSAEVTLKASGRRVPGTSPSGAILIQANGAAPVRLPWTLAPAPTRPGKLVSVIGLSRATFAPARKAASTLTFRAGLVESHTEGLAIEPVSLLEAELWQGGKRLGVVARMRDLLPGTYRLGLTGRGPAGGELPDGRYTLKLRARSADAREGDPGFSSVATTPFVIRAS